MNRPTLFMAALIVTIYYGCERLAAMRLMYSPQVIFRLMRLRLHRRLVRAERHRFRAFLVSKQEANRFDERSTMDRFRRESGCR